MNKTLIIVPAFNERESIEAVLAEIEPLVARHAYDIVVIDDGSADGTGPAAARRHCAVVSHPINLGAGAAIQTGLKYALLGDYDQAVVIDGDGQHDPREAHRLIETMSASQADVVIGSRFLRKGSGRTSWPRRIGIALFSALASLIGRQKITDVTSGYRAFNKKAIQYLSVEIPPDFPDADMLLELLFAGFRIVEIPVGSRERKTGVSMFAGLRSVYYPFKLVIAIIAVVLKIGLLKRRPL